MKSMNILNIVNFIRGAEPRNSGKDLLLPVKKQYELIKKYDLAATFLFQHNALENREFTDLIIPDDKLEVGLWIELNQELVEEAGGIWRGREGYTWDYYSQASLLIGYAPELRKKIIDAAMEKFRSVYGEYPKTVAAWSIDAVSFLHLEEKYHITASMICKEQWGTDGYSLWGGYYNQAYYPSKNNAFCPANNQSEQINIPVFRMLGSDPIDQYFCESDHNGQNVVSLEPSYPESGGNPEWVKWFFREIYNNKSMSFGYAQAGQENSFGWELMKDGYIMQMEFIAKHKDDGMFTLMTAAEAGEWYKNQYCQTPVSAVVARKDDGRQGIWYCSKYYRTNIYHSENVTYFQDLFLFDSRYSERYLKAVCNGRSMYYDNLPVIDSYRCSGSERAGAYFIRNNEKVRTVGEISTRQEESNILHVTIPTEAENTLISLYENRIVIKTCCELVSVWERCGNSPERADDSIAFTYNGFAYSVRIAKGAASVEADKIRIVPSDGEIVIDTAVNRC